MPQRRWPAAAVALVLSVLAVPTAAQAASVTLRVESTSSTLVPKAKVELPSTPVAPSGALDGQTCPGNSVIGALDAATEGSWEGVWSDTTGWSTVTKVKGIEATEAQGREWLVFVNLNVTNRTACQAPLNDGDQVLIYPACKTIVTSQCFAEGPLDFFMAETAPPGNRNVIKVFETTVSWNSVGDAVSQRSTSAGARLQSPEGSALTDTRYGSGEGILTLLNKGPALITVTKSKHVPDRGTICITSGEDGYCGTTVPPTNPFNPLDFCTTTGDDGECGSPDLRAPLGRIAEPVQARSFARGKGPDTLKGTVDRDPSEVTEVQIRLKRQSRVFTTKVRKKRVWVKRRVRGKIVRKRVLKRVRKRVRVARCYQWNSSKTAWAVMKSCKSDATLWFKADGDEVWQYAFTAPLPGGTYVLDARAKDGKGNVDTALEVGRNRVNFTVK